MKSEIRIDWLKETEKLLNEAATLSQISAEKMAQAAENVAVLMVEEVRKSADR